MAVYDPRGGGNVHFDQILTNISIGWPGMQDMTGPELFPPVNVKKQSDKYYVFGRESWRPEPFGDLRAPGTVANEIPGIVLSLDSYFAKEHALQIAITDEETENADTILQPMADGTELVTSKIMLGREIAMRDKAVTASGYASGYSTTLSGTAQWNDYVNSDPIGDIRVGRKKIHDTLFTEPNVAVIPWEVMFTLEQHPDFIERIKYSERGIVTPEIIAAMFGLPRILVPGSGTATGNPGQTATYGYLWGKDVILAFVTARAGMKIQSLGYEFVWGYNGSPQEVTRWREEPRKSWLVRVGRRYDLKFVSVDASGLANAAYLIKAAIA